MVTVAFSLSSNCASGRPTRLERPMTMAFMPSSEACTLLVSMMQPSGVQGDSASKPPASRPALFGCRPSTSLAGSMALMTASVFRPFGSGSCTRMPCTAGSRLSFATTASRSACEHVGRQLVLERDHAGGLGLGKLGADINLAGGIAADQHHGEARHQIVLALDASNLVGDAGAEFRGNDFSIDDLGRHVSSLVRRFGAATEPASVAQGFPRAVPDRRRPQSASAAR